MTINKNESDLFHLYYLQSRALCFFDKVRKRAKKGRIEQWNIYLKKLLQGRGLSGDFFPISLTTDLHNAQRRPVYYTVCPIRD